MPFGSEPFPSGEQIRRAEEEHAKAELNALNERLRGVGGTDRFGSPKNPQDRALRGILEIQAGGPVAR